MNKKEYSPCYYCKEGNIGVYYPDTYDDNSIHGIRAVCQNSECQQKEKELYEAEERKFNDKINKNQEQKESYESAKKQAEEKLNNLQQQRINETFTCRGSCGKVIGLDEKAYTWEEESGYYCQNCAAKKINQEYDQKHGQQPTNHSICSLCKIKPADYRWPDNDKLICEGCKPRFVLNLATIEKIMKGQEVDIDSLSLPEADKVSLRAGQRIMKGETVNVDNLSIDDEDKEVLRELQKQKPPQKNSPSKYVYECQDCGKKEESAINPFSCYGCQSRNIKVWKDRKLPPGNQQQKTNDPNKKILGLDPDTLSLVIIANLIFWPVIIWLIVRWQRKRRSKNNH